MASVDHLTVRNLYGRLDLDVAFHSDITILFGKNGAAKTTTLHILANALGGMFERFAFLEFDEILISLSPPSSIRIVRETAKDKGGSNIRVEFNGRTLVRPFPVEDAQTELLSKAARTGETKIEKRVAGQIKGFSPTPVTYFPAFRTALEAADRENDRREYPSSYAYQRMLETEGYWDSLPSERRFRGDKFDTLFARELFGDFVPVINYPSPASIERELSVAVREAYFDVSRSDQQFLTEAFLEAFAALGNESEPERGESAEALLQDIRQSLDTLADKRLSDGSDLVDQSIYERLRSTLENFTEKSLEGGGAVPFLKVYRDSLRNRVRAQERAYTDIDKYVNSVNQFLENKELSYAPYGARLSRMRPYLSLPGGGRASIKSLSSGERQVVSLLYATMRKKTGEVVLIDEPEISLHVDWQRLLIRKMSTHLTDKQLIVCTHAPEIAAQYLDRMVPIEAVDTMPTNQSILVESSSDDLDYPELHEDGDL